MRKLGVTGSFASAGFTGLLVDLLNEGVFKSLADVQCFDREARHRYVRIRTMLKSAFALR